jgi:signal transduction histidine kinase
MIQKMARRDAEHTALFALECQNDIKDAIRNLYEIRRSLDPNELAQGLVEPVRMAAERAKRLRGLNTHILASPEVDEGLSPPARRALYRMIKQALDNTLAHANASNFHVRLEMENQKVRFVIADDGKGSTTEQRNLALTSGHMGLKTMRTRIESLGGEFTYHSQSGAGTQISGWVPAA